MSWGGKFIAYYVGSCREFWKKKWVLALVRLTVLFFFFLQFSCKISVSGGDGRRHRSSRLGKGQAVVYSTSPPDTDEEYDAMEASTERASRQEAEELQHQFDA